jgi:hypothetical protein
MQIPGSSPETSLYGPYGSFFGDLLVKARKGGLVTQTVGVGGYTPDFMVSDGSVGFGWIEVKAPGKNLDRLTGHDKKQTGLYKQHLDWWLLTNGWQWRLWSDGEVIAEVQFSDSIFKPGAAKTVPNTSDLGKLDKLMRRFLSRSLPAFTSPKSAVERLARAAAVLRFSCNEVFAAGPPGQLKQVYEEFKGLVYQSGVPFSEDDFADTYAQTAAFGLLLARTTSGQHLTPGTAQNNISSSTHPFIWRCVSILFDQQVREPLSWAIDEILSVVNRIPQLLFAQPPKGPDPLLYAYEWFFAEYDPSERRSRGVYYTPPEVVDYQISGVKWLLERYFDGASLSSPEVSYLDPATGTGTYILGLVNAVWAEADQSGQAPDAAVKSLIDSRLHAFELMVGPYAVAHQRIAQRLARANLALSSRVPVYLMNTLAEPMAGSATSRLGIFGNELVAERTQAEQVKSSEPILVVLGNPPWGRKRRKELGDEWLQGLMANAAQRTPKEHRSDLKAFYDLFSAFWRWSLWLIGERTAISPPVSGKGIVSYITNRTWIVGTAFDGLRDLVRERASAVYVVDLGGDLRGSPSVSGTADEPIFDIQTGTAIVFAVLDPDHTTDPTVYYKRIMGTRKSKSRALERGFRGAFREVAGTASDPFLFGVWHEAENSPGIEEVFDQRETGVQTSRDSLVVATTLDELSARLNGFASAERAEQLATFHETRDRSLAPSPTVDLHLVTRYAYRPLDYRFLLNQRTFVDWHRPGLQDAFAVENLALVTISRDFGIGPAAIPVNAIPDVHAFRGHGGSRGIYPLFRGASTQQTLVSQESHNLTQNVQEWLQALLGDVPYRRFFSYCAAMLGAPFYTDYFESGLDRERPRIPLTLDRGVFEKGAALGDKWIASWTLSNQPSGSVRWASSSPGPGRLGEATWSAGRVSFSGGRTLEGCTSKAWDYRVSGRPLLENYFAARSDWDQQAMALLDELRLVVSSVNEIASMGDQLDEFLAELLGTSLHSIP